MTHDTREIEKVTWQDRFDVALEAPNTDGGFLYDLGEDYQSVDFDTDAIKEFIHQELQKVREEERERFIKVVEDYGKSMSKLHSEMIGTAHEDSKMMLAFDMHSRLIAVKHITEKMHHSELDQDTDCPNCDVHDYCSVHLPDNK